jgi:hypothetical protein
MKTLSSRMYIFAAALVSLLPLILNCEGASGSTQTRIIDRHGSQIPTIFYGTSPNPKMALEYSRIMKAKGRNPSSCSALKAVYHPADGLAHFLNVSGCASHWQVDYFRICNHCGGQDDWTFTDSNLSDYCTGYTSEYVGCDTQNCLIDYTCYNSISPGC